MKRRGLMVLSAAFLCGAARADPTVDLYTVQAGDDCPSVAEKALGDRKRIDLLHQLNNLGAPPHHLREGMVLRVPHRGPPARLTFVRNQVEAHTPEPHPGQKDEALARGHKVNTRERSSAEITFADQSRLALGEETLVVVLGGTTRRVRKGEAEDTTLMSGTLHAHLDALAGDLPVRTPAAELRLGAGQAQVAVDQKKATRLSVYRGRSRLRSQGKEVTVDEGFGSRAEPGQPPSAPRRLPPAPVWQALAGDRVEVVAPAEGGRPVYNYSVSFAAVGEPAPTGFHLQLARDERFNDLVLDARVAASVTRLEAPGLVAGTYFAQVRAVDAEGFEGPPTPLLRAVIEAGPVVESPPPPVVTPPAVTPAAPPPPVTPPPPPPVTPPPSPPPAVFVMPPRQAFEAAALATLHLDLGGGRVAGGVGAEAGLRFQLGPVLLAAGLRARYEHHGYEPGVRAACQPERNGAPPCLGASAPGWWTLSARDLLSLELPLSYRPLSSAARVQPYLGLAAQLLWDFSQVVGQSDARSTVRTARPALSPFLGAQVRAGGGALFGELALRLVFHEQRVVGDDTLSGLQLHLGYRG